MLPQSDTIFVSQEHCLLPDRRFLTVFCTLFLLLLVGSPAKAQFCTAKPSTIGVNATCASSCFTLTASLFQDCMYSCGMQNHCTLSGYTLVVASPLPASVNLGSTANATISVVNAPGYIGTITLSCALNFTVLGGNGIPPTQCALQPSSIVFNPQHSLLSPQTVKVSVSPTNFRGNLNIGITALDQNRAPPDNPGGSLALGPLSTIVTAGGSWVSLWTFCGLFILWTLWMFGSRKRRLPQF
jgi:hypothetical protein